MIAMIARSLIFSSSLVLLSIYSARSQNFIQSINNNDPYLAQLFEIAAENNPDLQTIDKQVNISKLELERTKYEWANNIRATGNLNEFSINPSRNENNIFYPRYNFSVTLPIGLILQQGKDNLIASEKVKINQTLGTKLQLDIKYEIMKRYNNLIRLEELLLRQTELTDSELSNYLILEEKFKNNTAELKDLNEAERNYNRELFKQINFQNELNSARLDLENIIGAPLPPR
jgi:outer membrane protein TolC